MWVLVGIFSMGVTIGIFSAILGLGGGIFLVPALTLILHLPIRVAVGTSLVGIIATSAGVAAVTPHGHGGNVELGLRLEVATTAGAILGSWLAGLISSQVLSILFSIVVFVTAGYLVLKTGRRITRQGKKNYLQRITGLSIGQPEWVWRALQAPSPDC